MNTSTKTLSWWTKHPMFYYSTSISSRWLSSILLPIKKDVNSLVNSDAIKKRHVKAFILAPLSTSKIFSKFLKKLPWIRNKQISSKRFFFFFSSGLEVEIQQRCKFQAHFWDIFPNIFIRIISEMMIFICQKWWWSMANFMTKNFTFKAFLKAVQGARKMKPNDSMMYSGSWWAGFLGCNVGRIFPHSKKSQLPGLPRFLNSGFLLDISSYPWLSLILIAPFPFMKLINSLRAAKQHAAPKESWAF